MAQHTQLKRAPRLRPPARGDVIAGITNALVYLPQGIGYGIVSGVNPLLGLYAGVLAPALAAVTTGSVFMVVIATNELSVPTGRLVREAGGDFGPERLATLTFLVGAFALVAGLLRLGRMVRFISNSVMTGFVLGIMLSLILGQVPNLLGFSGALRGNDLERLAQVTTSPAQVNLAASALGLVTIATVFALQRTRARNFAFLIPLIALTALVTLAGASGVPLAGEGHTISNGLPALVLPDLTAIPALLGPALSLTVIGLSFGAAVAETYPNPDGRISNHSRDFAGQGIANLGSALIGSLPVAGSMSRTVYAVEAGARSRWANVITGATGLVLILTVASLAALVPLSVVAGMLIVIGVNAINPGRLRLVWGVNWGERAMLVLTAALTVLVTPTVAILCGVILSLSEVLIRSAQAVEVQALTREQDGSWVEQPMPRALPSDAVMVARVRGFLYFAGVETLDQLLAPALESQRLGLVLSLRGYGSLGSTGIAFLERFAKAMRARGNTLLLAEVDPRIVRELTATRVMAVIGAHNVYARGAAGDASLDAAVAAAETRV